MTNNTDQVSEYRFITAVDCMRVNGEMIRETGEGMNSSVMVLSI